MLRREFLVRSAGGGTLLVSGGLMTGVGSALATGPAHGYAVGQRAVWFSGYDQYMKVRSLKGNLGYWTMIDLCPWWCPPCVESAARHKAFRDYVNGQGIPFRILSVVVEDAPEDTPPPSVRLDAEKWAVAFGLEKEFVLHDNGVANSPLRLLCSNFAFANSDSATYPTYLLVDPTGVIRSYHTGYSLDLLQDDLAGFTGQTLSADWTLTDFITAMPTYGLVEQTASASFHLWDGTLVTDSSTFDPSVAKLTAGHCTISNGGGLQGFDDVASAFNVFRPVSASLEVNLWDVLGDSITPDNQVEDHSKLFDLYSPISIHLADAGFYRTYNRLDGTPSSVTIQFSEFDPAYYQSLGLGDSQPTGYVYAPISFNADGSVDIGPVTPSDFFPGGPQDTGSWGDSDDARASNVMAMNLGISANRITPYQASIDLAAAVNADASLSLATQSSVINSLQRGRNKLGNRDYAGAATLFARAAHRLSTASADPNEQSSADWIAAHIDWLATH